MNRYFRGVTLLMAMIFVSGNAQMDWDEAVKLDTPSGYESYLEKYPQSEFSLKAKERLEEEVIWAKAVDKRTFITLYERYLELYPNGKHVEDAKLKIEELLWDKIERNKTYLTLYLKYRDKFPNGKHAEDAKLKIEELLWDKAENNADITLYRKYLEMFPNGKYAEQARECDTWAITEAEGSADYFKKYLNKYPKGRFADYAIWSLNKNKNLDGELPLGFLQFFQKQVTIAINQTFSVMKNSMIKIDYGGHLPTGGSIACLSTGTFGTFIINSNRVIAPFKKTEGFNGTLDFACSWDVVKNRLEIISLEKVDGTFYYKGYIYRKAENTPWTRHIPRVFKDAH